MQIGDNPSVFGRARRAGIAATVTTLALALLLAMPAGSARADGSLEWQSGGKFDRLAGGRGDGEQASPAPGKKTISAARSKSSATASSASSEEAPKRRAGKGTRVASLGRSADTPPKPSGSVSGGGNVTWVASASCLASNLRSAINYVAQNYGAVRVNSTCRSRAHNRRVGGAPRSYHLTGDAADIRLYGNVRGALAYLRSSVGGLKHYGGGLFHIDNGLRRSF
jgi:hypothetical protein